MRVGTVVEMWRHPVKSMQGERITGAEVAMTIGIPGDRGWAVRDEEVQEIRGAKRLPGLMRCAAHYTEEPVGESTPVVEVTLPDGRVVRTDDESIHGAISELVGRQVTIWPRVPATDEEHYRRKEGFDEAEMRREYGLADDDPLPDLSAIPEPVMDELLQFASPRGTYFDVFELHLLTTTSIASLAAHTPSSDLDVRRFRPNLLVEVDPGAAGCNPDYPEQDWIGREVRIGGLVARVEMPMQRCSMTGHQQVDLPVDRQIIRALLRATHLDLGVGMSVVVPGPVAVGDAVVLE